MNFPAGTAEIAKVFGLRPVDNQKFRPTIGGMPRRKLSREARPKVEVYTLTVIQILSNVSNVILDELFRDVRFVRLHHNRNNPLVVDECWIRGDDCTVYTNIKFYGKVERAHRVSYELFRNKALLNYGCHHCDCPACINPNHIFDGTNKQNMWDARRKHRMYGIKLSNKHRMDWSEKRLRKVYPTMTLKEVEEDIKKRRG